MIKILFKYFLILLNSVYFYWLSIIFFSLYFLYLLYYNYLNIDNLIISFIISLFFIFYKINLDLFCIVVSFEKLRNNDFLINFFVKLNEKVLIKNKWLIKPIYFILYYFPTNWFFLIIVWIAKKWWNIRLFINSNKDIIGKKYLNKNLSKMKSPLNYKYFKWIKIYIFDVLFQILYIPLFLKINIMGKELNKYFFYKIYGIVYSTVLIVNNLHIFIWFKTTSMFELKYKILICFLIFYIFLFFFVNLVDFLVNNVSTSNFLRLKEKNLKLNELKLIANRNLWVNFFLCLKTQKISNYLYVKNFLIMFCLAEKYRYVIDCYYGLYITKNILYLKSDINLISNLIKLNKMESSFSKISSFKDIFDVKNFNENFTHIDYIWMFEKNYNEFSFFFFNFLFNLDSFFYFKILNYELYKTFYGEEIINEHFKEEIEEFIDIFFIYKLWYYWLYNELNVDRNIIYNCFKNNYKYIIPLNINNNNNYNKLLYSFDFILLGQINNLVLMNYYDYFNSGLALHIQVIYSDIQRYESEYGNDVNKFVYFWEIVNKQSKEDILMKLRFEVFSKHIPNAKNLLININEKVKFIFLNNKKENKSFQELIFEKQENYKKKYIFKNPKLNKSYGFLEKYSMKEEWKFFDEKKQNMFF